jgi:hypothetical protein
MATMSLSIMCFSPLVYLPNSQQNLSIPPADASNNDEAFLTLLSAQRALLNQMNMEKIQQRKQQQMLLQQSEQQRQAHKQGRLHFQHERMVHQYPPHFEATTEPSGLGKHYLHLPFYNKTLACSFDPFSVMSPVITRRSSVDYLNATRRLSMKMGIGVGKDSFVMSSELDDEWTEESDAEDASAGHYELKRKTYRRRSSLGILSTLMLCDPQMSTTSRRGSLISTVSKSFLDSGSMHSNQAEDMTSLLLVDSTMSIERGDPNDLKSQVLQQRKSETEFSMTKSDRSVAEKIEQGVPHMRLRPCVDLPTLTKMIKMFSEAMTSSTKSQQDIHDWDRKMGLKRSHSKTMRMSMRSRKKLRAVMNKEMATICRHDRHE